MIPILFPAAETAFTDMRRQLADAAACTVRQATGGYDELSMRYPMIGAYFSELALDALILAQPSPWLRPQPYRIYDISRPSNGLVVVSARHIAYDGRGIPVAPFKAVSAQDAAQKLKSQAVTACPFTFTTDISLSKDMEVLVPKTLRELYATDADSWLNTYGGGLRFDFYTVSLLANPGADRGVVIRYGVDLVDAQQEENIANVYTGVLPFWQGMKQTVTPSQDPDEDDEITEETVTVMGSVQRASGSFAVEKIQPLDLSAYFDEPPTAADLNSAAVTWMRDHHVGVPEVSLRVSYAALGQDVRLYDTVTVEFPMLGISTRSTVTAAVFDVLREIYTDVEIGAVQAKITDTLTDASRLKKGTLPKQRIARQSIGGDMIARGGVSSDALAALAVTREKLAALSVGATKLQPSAVTAEKIRNGAVKEGKIADDAVTVNKIKNGAVVSEKIGPGAVVTDKLGDYAVTGAKILDQAVNFAKIANGAVGYDKLDYQLQVFYTDVLAAIGVFASFMKADGSIEADVVSINNYLSIKGTIYEPKTYQVRDTHPVINYDSNRYVESSPVYDWDDTQIGETPDVYYIGSISSGGTETHLTYNLRVLGPRDMD